MAKSKRSNRNTNMSEFQFITKESSQVHVRVSELARQEFLRRIYNGKHTAWRTMKESILSSIFRAFFGCLFAVIGVVVGLILLIILIASLSTKATNTFDVEKKYTPEIV